MSTPDLDAIKIRDELATKGVRGIETKDQIIADREALLAYARDLEARIGRVEALAVASEPFKFHGGYTSSGIVLANDIFAALTATDAS